MTVSKEALEELGFDINAIEDKEPDPALRNGGLGKTCGSASLILSSNGGYHAYGCGIQASLRNVQTED